MTTASQVVRQHDWSELISRIALGDECALMRLYNESGPLVYGIALRIIANAADAEETTADVYRQVWRTAERFDGAKSDAAGWLSMIARSRAIDRYRSKSNRHERQCRAAVLGSNVQDFSPLPELQSILEQRRKLVRQALSQLREAERRAVECVFFLGLTHSELAEREGIPLGTAKSRVRAGMHRLKERLSLSLRKTHASRG